MGWRNGPTERQTDMRTGESKGAKEKVATVAAEMGVIHVRVGMPWTSKTRYRDFKVKVKRKTAACRYVGCFVTKVGKLSPLSLIRL
jgi:hypothetical protein